MKVVTVSIRVSGPPGPVPKKSLSHEAQLVNYLKATGLEVGLLINFGERVEIKRKVLTPPGAEGRSQEIDCPIS
jgi:hypothetical protein